jgi:hypothetical protein
MVQCSKCQTLNPPGSAFCGDCGASLPAQRPQPDPSPPPVQRPPPTQPQQVVFYSEDDVTITSARAVLGAKSYALSGVKSVEVIHAKDAASQKRAGIILTVTGLIGLALGVLLMRWTEFFEGLDGLFYCLTPAALFAISGLVGVASASDKWTLRVKTASGKEDVLSAREEAWIRAVADAMTQAITARGRRAYEFRRLAGRKKTAIPKPPPSPRVCSTTAL